MKKRLVALLLCLAMSVTAFSGCSNTNQSNSLPGSANNSAASSPSDSSKNTTAIRVMCYNAENTRAKYLYLLKEKMPNIKITYDFVTMDNFDNVLNTQLASSQGPDIIEVGGETKLLAKAGHLMDLTSQSFTQKYVNSGLTPYSVNNKVYATPLQSWFEGIFYNKNIFKKYKVTVPKTFDEWIELIKNLQSKGVKAETLGAQSWQPMMKQSIGLVNNVFYSNSANKAFDQKFNQGQAKLADAWLPATTEWSKMITKGCLTKDMLGLSDDQAVDEFATGKAAMYESGPWSVPTIMQKNPNINLGMFPMPGLKEGPGWLVGGPGSGFAINANTAHSKECLQILDFTATPEAQAALIKDNTGSSFLKGVDISLPNIYDDCKDAFKAGNVYAPWTAAWDNGNAVVEAYGKSLQEVLAGTKTVKQALTDADQTNMTMIQSTK